MGRNRKFDTPEEREKAHKEAMRRYYKNNKEKIILRSRLTYYRNQLELHPDKSEKYLPVIADIETRLQKFSKKLNLEPSEPEIDVEKLLGEFF